MLAKRVRGIEFLEYQLTEVTESRSLCPLFRVELNLAVLNGHLKRAIGILVENVELPVLPDRVFVATLVVEDIFFQRVGDDLVV